MSPPPLQRATVLYDRDCRFCIWSLAKVLAWDRRKRLRPVALQDAEAAELLPWMGIDRRMASWHLVTPDGRVASAGRAFGPLLRRLPGGWPLAALVERFPRAADRVYFAVADRRSTLGRLLPAGVRNRARGRVEAR